MPRTAEAGDALRRWAVLDGGRTLTEDPDALGGHLAFGQTMATKTADVVFVFPPAYGNVGAFRNHLGAAYLRAALARESISSVQYLNPNPGTVDQVVDDIVQRRPGVVGFTVYDSNLALAVAVARAVKRKRPGIRVVFGGPSATFCARPILERQPDVDACVMGEAEQTGARIFTRLLDPGDVQDAPPGLAVRRDGEIVGTGLPPLAGAQDLTLSPRSTLDAVPSPYLTGILEDGRTGILTGRGCTHHCQYCCFAALGRRTLRLHSIDRVVAELQHVADVQKRTGEHYLVPIHDDAFTLLPARAKSLCQAIIDRHLGLVLSCITRADAVDEELLRLMRGAGFASVSFGLESAVPSVLRATGKVRPPGWGGADLEPEREFTARVRSSVATAKKLGFQVSVSIILGLPTESPEDGEATLRFVKDLRVDLYLHNFLWVFPGTPLWETHDRYGIRCAFNSMGLAETTDYAYDVTKLRPRPGCSLEEDARVIRTFTAEALHDCGASLKPDGGTSVAVLRAEVLTPECAHWLVRILDVGSVLVQVYPWQTRTEEALRLCEDRRTFSTCLVPARYHVQVLRRPEKGGNARWRLVCPDVDLYATHKPELVSLTTSDGPGPFLDWLRGAPVECALCDVADLLRQPEELGRLLDQTGQEGLSGRLRRMPVPPGLQYPGRWLEGRAPCLSLARIEIDSEGRVRPCRHGEPVGAVGDPRPTLERRLAALAAEAERRRGCGECPQTECPRCPFPDVDDHTYCSIMRSQGRALGFLKWARVYSRVPTLLSLELDRLGGE